jgi:hypothetical protein
MINKSFIFTTDDTMVIALKRLWKNNIPSKISIFGWKLLLEKLQTREALYHKKGSLPTIWRGVVSFVFIWKRPLLISSCNVVLLWLPGNIFLGGWVSIIFSKVLCRSISISLVNYSKARLIRDFGG